VSTPDELCAAVNHAGVRLVRVPSDRDTNLAVHRAINAAVATALT
jgi:hypothetical protein